MEYVLLEIRNTLFTGCPQVQQSVNHVFDMHHPNRNPVSGVHTHTYTNFEKRCMTIRKEWHRNLTPGYKTLSFVFTYNMHYTCKLSFNV